MNYFPSITIDWPQSSVGKYCDVQLGKMLQNEASSELDELKQYLRAVNISKNGLDVSHEFTMWVKPQEIAKYKLLYGDILVSEGGDAGRTCVFNSKEEYYFQNAINRIRPLKECVISSEFIYYWFTFLKLSGYVDMVCNVATISHFTAEKVKAAPLIIPPLPIQQRIASFLDEKTAFIDGAIAKKRELLERLAEKRQALITQAVTKGLNPDAPMKPSGIDWLGDIPAHWEVVRLNRLVSMKSGDMIPAKEINDEGTYPVYGGNGFRGYTDTFNTAHDTVLIGRQGAYCGNVHITKESTFVTEHALRCLPKIKINHKWFATILEVMRLGDHSVSAAQPGLSVDRLNMLQIVLPPIREQEIIVEKITTPSEQYDCITSKIQHSIDLLTEYRSALITAAVTGQIAELL